MQGEAASSADAPKACTGFAGGENSAMGQLSALLQQDTTVFDWADVGGVADGVPFPLGDMGWFDAVDTCKEDEIKRPPAA